MKGFIRIELLIAVFMIFLGGAVASLAWISARVEARDQIRIIDISKIQQALNVFFEENGFYPPAEINKAKNFEEYLENWPTPPKKDGTCTEIQNQYSYSQKLNGDDYNLSFCLGRNQGSIKAGVHTLTAKGIK